MEQLDTTMTKETPIKRKLTDNIPQAPIEKSKLTDRDTSKKKEEDSQPTEMPPRRKMLVKKLKAQQSPPSAHYSFVSAKGKKMFIEVI